MVNKKVKQLKELRKILEKERRVGKKVVFTNGCFDILHLGHVQYLEEAKSFGDILVVGLNSDSSVKKLKKNHRPIMDESSRAGILAALECVDYITIFKEETPFKLINFLRPDILVKGGDWKKEDIVGGNLVIQYGGKVKSVPYIKGHSSSRIIEQIRHPIKKNEGDV